MRLGVCSLVSENEERKYVSTLLTVRRKGPLNKLKLASHRPVPNFVVGPLNRYGAAGTPALLVGPSPVAGYFIGLAASTSAIGDLSLSRSN